MTKERPYTSKTRTEGHLKRIIEVVREELNKEALESDNYFCSLPSNERGGCPFNFGSKRNICAFYRPRMGGWRTYS